MADLNGVGGTFEHPKPAPIVTIPFDRERDDLAMKGLRPVAPPPLTPPEPSLARARLRTAHRRLEEARRAHAKAAQYVLDARRVVAVLDQEVEGGDDLDEAVARYKADAIKSGQPLTLPAGLVARRRRRDACEAELDDAVAARDRLLAEEAEARRVEGGAAHQLAEAVDVLVDCEIAAELAKLEGLQRDALASERRLIGMLVGPPAIGRLSQVRAYARRALDSAPSGAVVTVNHDPAVVAAADRLADYRARLLGEPEAQPD